MFDKITKLLFLGMLAAVVYVTIFDGDLNGIKRQALSRMPAAATTISLLLPTPSPTRRIVIRVPAEVDLDTGDNLGGVVLPDCATAPTTTACAWRGPTPEPTVPAVVEHPPVDSSQPVFDTSEEDLAPDPPSEPVLEVAPAPVSVVLSTTADYRSDCHAMFASHEDKSSWATDIAACEATGDYK